MRMSYVIVEICYELREEYWISGFSCLNGFNVALLTKLLNDLKASSLAIQQNVVCGLVQTTFALRAVDKIYTIQMAVKFIMVGVQCSASSYFFKPGGLRDFGDYRTELCFECQKGRSLTSIYASEPRLLLHKLQISRRSLQDISKATAISIPSLHKMMEQNEKYQMENPKTI